MLAAGVAAALTVPMALVGGAAFAEDAPEVAGAGVAESGELHWGVRTTIRNYLERFEHTGGSVSAYDGATYAKGDAQAVFPVSGGEIDAEAGTASLSFDGELDMRGFDEPWLDFTNVRLEAADGEAQIIVDMLASFNTQETTADLVLAEFTLPEDGFEVDGNTVTLSTGEGTFPEDIGMNHLPSYGGPTYVGDNAYTDGFDLTVNLDEQAPAEPNGTSVGEPYSDSDAVMSVTPAFDLNQDGETEVTITGSGYDSTSPIYVGLGTMTNPSDPEQWRRSKGGFSGDGPKDDYTYGLPRLVVANGSQDANLADGAMDEDGNWSLTVAVPGAKFESFFGGEIDCLTVACGFFSFGAHGKVSAKNEAYTPVTFATATTPENPGPGNGSDDDDQPGPDDPTPIDIPDKKSEPFGESTGTNPSGASLTVAPAYALKDKDQKVKLTGKNFPTSGKSGSNFGGLYVLFGWVDQGKWYPSENGRSGSDFTYVEDIVKDGNPAGIYQRMVNYPGNTTEPNQPFMDKNGNWTMDFTIRQSQFTSVHDRTIDCYQMQCGIITIGAHGQQSPGGEVFTPVYFTETAEETGNQTPDAMPTAAVTANPNFAQQAADTLANTGVENRMMLFGGLFVTSLGLFALALLTLRRRGGATSEAMLHSPNDVSASQ
ncbi:MAG: HtaA domain-containing protein [Canibacter sp.]